MIKKMADIDIDIIYSLGAKRAGQTINHHRRPDLWADAVSNLKDKTNSAHNEDWPDF